MKRLPQVSEVICEKVARDFDDIGPDACMAEIVDDLLIHNPHYLEIASRCARDVGDHRSIMTGFCIFYRILSLGMAGAASSLPRITAGTCDTIVLMIDEIGAEAFVLLVTETLEEENPQLMRMADGFASRHENYPGIMRGFLLLYKSLGVQAVADGLRLNSAFDLATKGFPAPPHEPR